MGTSPEPGQGHGVRGRLLLGVRLVTTRCRGTVERAGAAGFAVVGINQAELLTPSLGAMVLGGYALVAVVTGSVLMQRRDIA